MASRALTQGILKLMEKMKACTSDLVKSADSISELPVAAVPETLAPGIRVSFNKIYTNDREK